jgi:hypothetical protein
MINQGTVTAGSNYDITFVDGMFYINPFGPGTKKVRTYLDCVQRTPKSTYDFVANFRYENNNSFAVFVPRGIDNFIQSATGGFSDTALPELFLSGGGTFSVPFDGEKLIWTLASYESNLKTSVSSDASSSSNKCGNNYAALTIASITEELPTELQVYPNPVVDKVVINFGPDANISDDVVIYDAQGKMHRVNTVWRTSQEIELDMTSMLKGQYLIRVHVDNNFELIRIVKMH